MAGYSGGYDLGHNQFAGGGFMPSPAPANDSGYGGGMQQKKTRDTTTLRAVTVRQLNKENAHVDDDQFKVDGIDISTITVVGKVTNIQDTAAMLLLVVDDGTGKVEVAQYLNDDGDGVQPAKPEFRVGSYVRVYGHYRAFNSKRSIQAYSVRFIQDYNEVTYHFLQCVFQHLHLTKGAPPSAPAPGVSPQAGYNSMKPAGGFGAGPGPSYGGASTAGYSAPSTAPSYAAAPQSGGVGGDINQDVLAIYGTPQCQASSHGLHIQEVTNMLAQRGAKYTFAQVREAVAFLANEGHLYSTIDEEHHKSCL